MSYTAIGHKSRSFELPRQILWAVGRWRSAWARGRKTTFTIHHSQFVISNACHLKPGTCTSESYLFHNPTYHTSLSFWLCQETKGPSPSPPRAGDGVSLASRCKRLAASRCDMRLAATSQRRLGGVYSSGIVKWRFRPQRQMALGRWTKALLTDDEAASAELVVVVGGYLKEAGGQWRTWPRHTGWQGQSGDSLD